jgi:hypothetical protein
MKFPQVAILHWDERKTDAPMYLPKSSFSTLVNGQLVIVTAQCNREEQDLKADLLAEDWKIDYWCHASNLTFLGEL